MARPKKPRYTTCGRLIPDNLYPAYPPKEEYWRYRGVNGKYSAPIQGMDEAFELAAQANEVRAALPPDAQPPKPEKTKRKKSPRVEFDKLKYYAQTFIAKVKEDDPREATQTTWQRKIGYVNEMAEQFSHRRMVDITGFELRNWWVSLSPHQQHSRKPTLRRFADYLISEGLTPKIERNPFLDGTLSAKSVPPSNRARMDVDTWWTIAQTAAEIGYQFVQDAMLIGMLTALRKEDILTLRFSDIDDSFMTKMISKSKNQLGPHRAEVLGWDLNEHQALRKVINRCRESSIKNFGCPFVISHRYKAFRPSAEKEHKCQVLSRFMCEKFAEARKAAGFGYEIDWGGLKPPSFHEIRATAANEYGTLGFTDKDISAVLAHQDAKITQVYLRGHNPKVVKPNSIGFGIKKHKTQTIIGASLDKTLSDKDL